jgi:hypothetical protein
VAGAAAVLHRLGKGAADVGQRPVHHPDDVGDGDLVGRAGQPVAALGAPLALHDAGVAQLGEDVLQELQRDALRLGDPVALDRPVAGRGQLDRRPHRVVRLRRHVHALILAEPRPPGTSAIRPPRLRRPT